MFSFLSLHDIDNTINSGNRDPVFGYQVNQGHFRLIVLIQQLVPFRFPAMMTASSLSLHGVIILLIDNVVNSECDTIK